MGPFRGEPDRPFFVGTVVEGGRIVRGTHVEENPPSDAFVAAACPNDGHWLEDVSLDADVVILSDPELYRSAELLDGDVADSDVALDAEQLAVEGTSPHEVVASLREGGASEREIEIAESYLDARTAPPSADVRERDVVYATNATTTTAVVERLAIEPEAERVEPTPSVVGAHVVGASALDVVGADVLGGLDDSQRTIAALVPAPGPGGRVLDPSRQRADPDGRRDLPPG